jgi:hypothetical protein
MVSIFQMIMGRCTTDAWTRDFEIMLLYHLISVYINEDWLGDGKSLNELLVRLVVTKQYPILLYLFFMTLPENQQLQVDINPIFHHNKQEEKWKRFLDGIKYIRTDHVNKNATGYIVQSTGCLDVVIACESWWHKTFSSENVN